MIVLIDLTVEEIHWIIPNDYTKVEKMRKKIIIYLIFILSSLSIYSTEYELLEESEYINFYGNKVGSLNKNNMVDIQNFYIFTSKEKPFYYATFDEYFIPVKVLNNQVLETKLPAEFISSCDTNGMFLYPYYVIEAVNKNNRNIIAQNDKKNTDIMTSNIDIEEYWYDYIVKPQLISDIGLVLGSAYGQYTLYVDDIKRNNTDEYILKIEVNDYIGRLKNPVFPDFKNGQDLNLRLKKDGDYLEVFVDNEESPRETYCYVNNDFRIAINKLVKNNSCENQNLTWPRHADGTSDYDDEIKQPLTQPVDNTSSLETKAKKISPAQTMSVTENLKLRSGEATSTEVLTIMAAGTKVKILELGHSETIDGITSNWVKVELLAGATDRDGNPIEKGTTGWCYGGYLEEAEEVLSDNQPNQEPAPIEKQSSNLLLIAILVSVGILLILVIILIILKKRNKKEDL